MKKPNIFLLLPHLTIHTPICIKSEKCGKRFHRGNLPKCHWNDWPTQRQTDPRLFCLWLLFFFASEWMNEWKNLFTFFLFFLSFSSRFNWHDFPSDFVNIRSPLDPYERKIPLKTWHNWMHCSAIEILCAIVFKGITGTFKAHAEKNVQKNELSGS